ncbi:MAG: PAS domain S-box protein [Ktedonobacterales bacterium]
MDSQHSAAVALDDDRCYIDGAAPVADEDQREASRAEALFRATFECSPIGMAHARVTGEFVRVNAALCAMLGYSEAELLTSSFQTVMHPEDLAETEAFYARIRAGEVSNATFERSYVRKDGTDVWGNLSLSVAFDHAGAPEYFLCVIEDISARKQSELEHAALAARERAAHLQSERHAAHLRAVLDVLPVGVYIAESDGSVNEWNKAGRDLWGDETPTVNGRSDYERYKAVWADTGMPIAAEERATARTLATGAIIANEEIIITATDGRQKTVLNSAGPIRDAHGEITGAVVTQVDITERKRLERELAERAAQLTAILDTMTEGVTFYDADGSIRLQNTAGRRMFGQVGVNDEQLESTVLAERAPLYDVRDLHGNPLPQEQWPIVRVLNGETLSGARVAETSIMIGLDQEVIVSYTGAPLRDSSGAITGAVIVARDVTEGRQFEREREQMLGLVSHELKTPLTSVKALAQLAQRQLARAERPEANLLQRMEHGLESMNRLINDLLDATRLDTGKMLLMRERCDLGSLCEQVVADQEVATGRNIVLQMPNVPEEVQADGTRLSQVLSNLLSNALKYSPAETPVFVELKRDRTGAHISVRDEGPGIPPEALPRLFKRFYRVPGIEVKHGTGVGLGLGLYLCQRLIDMHGGQLHVESTLGKGTTFEVILPTA